MWMLHCDKVSKFVSESMDRELSLFERVGVRVHLLMCRHCARFARQLEHMRSAIRKESNNYPRLKLDEDAKMKMKKRLDQDRHI
ncbi:MAG: hypothetical protein ACI8PB_004086 [Desulforhopalus sp.]|jgi:hypothetical protein